MSQQNVEVAKRGFDVFNRRDIHGFAETFTADYEWVGAFLGIVEGGSYRGRKGLAGGPGGVGGADDHRRYPELKIAKVREINVRLECAGATEERSAGLTAHEKSPASAGPF